MSTYTILVAMRCRNGVLIKNGIDSPHVADIALHDSTNTMIWHVFHIQNPSLNLMCGLRVSVIQSLVAVGEVDLIMASYQCGSIAKWDMWMHVLMPQLQNL